jgi:ADP-ribose pyrophosphatase YjhB (NUDIX family)
MSRLRHWVMRRAGAVHHRLWYLRAKTLGVRAIVTDGTSVLLVRHTYVEGWHLPGGAVDPGEAAEEAALREAREEAGIVGLERPQLLGFYRNLSHSLRDHVACYVIRRFETHPRPPDWEIAEIGFFPHRDLPAATSRGTRARLAELFDGVAVSADW